jgi:hypothetical protein
MKKLQQDVLWLDAQLARFNLELKLIEKGLFTKQNAFVKDPATRKTALCTRRAGKTTGVGFELLDALYDLVQGDCAYIGLTRGHAKKLMFNHFLKLKNTHNLKLTENRSDLTITCDKTGNTCYIIGANSEDDTEKIRGLKLKKIVLDEVASFKTHINYLIDEVLEPTTIDLNGSIIMIGTPSANPLDDNIFYRATTGQEKGWSNHSWSILDNPYIPHAKQWLDDYKVRKNWTDDHPIYLREWCGIWTRDDSSLVFKYKKEKQDYEMLPDFKWKYVMGVDLGFDDAFAIVVIAFSYDLPNKCFVVDEYKKGDLIPAKMAQQIIEFKNKYNPLAIVADTGGLGKAIVEEFKQRYKMNIEKAEKKDKLAYIEIVNGELISGSLKIKDNSELAKEMKVHQWDPDNREKEDDRTDNHLTDSLLYCFRKVRHYWGVEKMPEPKLGSFEYNEREAERMLQKQIEILKKQQENMEDL